MGGAIGEWSNSAPRAEPCHWATWVAPMGNSLDSLAVSISLTKSLLWTFPLAPPSPPLPPPGPRTHCRQIPGTQAPPAGGVQGATRPICGLPWAPLAPPAPPWPPLAPGPPWPPLALPAWPPALAALFGERDKCLPCGQGRGGN